MTRLSLFVLLIGVVLLSCKTNPEKQGYRLVWNDEFDYDGLPDESKWSYDTIGNSWGWGNNELQHYTVKRLENVEVKNGVLTIRAIKEKQAEKNYTSARMITKYKGDWLYGRIEVRAKLPKGKGLWPAIWMLPTDWEYGGWPESGEIDIMENVGFNPDSVLASVHTLNYNHKINTHRNGTIFLPKANKKFHVYAVEWDSIQIRAFVDDQLYFTFEKEKDDYAVWPFDKRFHLLINLAVGGDWGGMHGIDDSVFPVGFEIDYVRVYEK